MSYYMNADAAMRYYMLAVLSGEREVGGWAEFHIDDNGNEIITDLRPLKQESTAVYFEISEKSNALFLEEIVGEGKDPANFFLFHTHPSGMGASMSSVDVKQIEEMARDLPGKVVRSMILTQGKVHPLVHEAVCVDGKVFIKDDQQVTLLDTTGAHEDLKKIGWFDPKPKPKQAPTQRPSYGFGYQQPRPPIQQTRQISTPANTHGRGFSPTEGWYDKAPQQTEIINTPDDEYDSAWSNWLDHRQQDEDDKAELEKAKELVGERVQSGREEREIVDCYILYGAPVFILDNGDEVWDEDVKIISSDTEVA